MKKRLFAVILALAVMASFVTGCASNNGAKAAARETSCEEMLSKISTINESFTIDDIHSLLGEPTEIPPTGIYTEIYRWDGYEAIVRMQSTGLSLDLFENNTQRTRAII